MGQDGTAEVKQGTFKSQVENRTKGFVWHFGVTRAMIIFREFIFDSIFKQRNGEY